VLEALSVSVLLMELVGIVIVVLVAVFLNGIIAEIEDNSPGGFNNPDGKWIDFIKHPSRVQVAIWIAGALTIGFLIFLLFASSDT